MFTTRVEISPLQCDSEGKLRGGFSSVMSGQPQDAINGGCKNIACSNISCSNSGCINGGCANDNCLNEQCTSIPVVIITPDATTTTVAPVYKHT